MPIGITIRLRLAAGSTAASKAFEGALKLTFQLPEATRETERLAALAAAEQAAKDVEAALAAKPELAQDLVVSVGADGKVEDLDQFRSAVAKLGVFDRVFEAVKERLVAVTAQQLTADGQLVALKAEDFPLDRVTITPAGGFTFTGGSVSLPGGSLTPNFVPTAERSRRRAPPPGSSCGGNSNPNNDPPGGYLLVPGDYFMNLAVRAGGGLVVRRLLGGVTPTLQGYSLCGTPEGQALDDSGFFYGLAAHPTDDQVVYGILNSNPHNGNPVVSHLDTRATAALTPALPDTSLAQSRYCVATGRTRGYLGSNGNNVIEWFNLADPTATGSVMFKPGNGSLFAIAVHDDGVASPTLILPVPRSNTQVDIVALQEDGASRTIAALPSNHLVVTQSVAIASPSIYVGGLFDGPTTPLPRVYEINVNTGQLTTLVSRTTDASGTFQLPDDQIGTVRGLVVSADSKTLYWTTENHTANATTTNLIRFVLP